MVMGKVILHKGFSKSVSDPIFCFHWNDLDYAFPHMFPEVVITYIDVIGIWTESRKPVCTRVFFKDFTV